MKCQRLFSGKKKKKRENIVTLSSPELAQRVVKVTEHYHVSKAWFKILIVKMILTVLTGPYNSNSNNEPKLEKKK